MLAVLVYSFKTTSNIYAGKPLERTFGEILRRISILHFNFQEKWAQEILQKIFEKFHEPWNKILSQRDSGSLGAQQISLFDAVYEGLIPQFEMVWFQSIALSGTIQLQSFFLF